MTSKECEEQLQRLLYDWETEGLLTKLNATDIEAIKHLMLENQTQQDFIKTQNKLVHSLEININKAIEYINDNVAVYAFNNKDLPHWEFNDDDIKELLEILRGKDENN